MHIKFQKNLKLAIGGEWVMPSGKAEADAFLKPRRKMRVLDQKVMGERVIGAFGGKDPGTHAGAYLVGLRVPNAIVVHEVADGQFWVAAVRDGIPLADHDRVCDWETASRIMTDVLAFNPSAVLIGTAPSASRSLESVLADPDKKQLSASRIAAPGAAMRLVVVAVLGVAGLAMLAWGGWEYVGKRAVENAPQDSALAALATKERQRRAAEEYQLAVDAAVKEQRVDFGLGIEAAPALAFTRNIVQMDGLVYRGWKLRTVECDMSAGLCRKTWVKGVNGARQMDIAPLKERAGIKDAVGVESVNMQDIAYEQAHPTPEKVLVRVAGAGGALVAATLRDVYGMYGVTIQIPDAAVSVAATLPPPPEGIQQSPVVLGSTLDFMVSGSFAVLQAAAGKLDAVGMKVAAVKVENIDTLSPSASVTGKMIVEVTK